MAGHFDVHVFILSLCELVHVLRVPMPSILCEVGFGKVLLSAWTEKFAMETPLKRSRRDTIENYLAVGAFCRNCDAAQAANSRQIQ